MAFAVDAFQVDAFQMGGPGAAPPVGGGGKLWHGPFIEVEEEDQQDEIAIILLLSG